MKITKKQIESYVKFRLSTSKVWALECLKIVFHNQTLDEKGQVVKTRYMVGDEYESDETVCKNVFTGKAIYKNSEGFGRYDAPILNNIYKFYSEKGLLSDKQMDVVFKMIPKYWKQFLKDTDPDKLQKMCINYYQQQQ